MNADINCFNGTGRLGKDALTRHTTGQKPTAVCDLSVAMTIGWGDRQTTLWTRITVWGKQAEFLGKYAKKGDLVIWSGATYKVDKYTDKDGQEKTTHFFEVGQGGMVNLVSKQRQDSSHDGEEDLDDRPQTGSSEWE